MRCLSLLFPSQHASRFRAPLSPQSVAYVVEGAARMPSAAHEVLSAALREQPATLAALFAACGRPLAPPAG